MNCRHSLRRDEIPGRLFHLYKKGRYRITIQVTPNSAARTITLTNDFYLAVFETTQAQWAAVPPATPDSAPGGLHLLSAGPVPLLALHSL